MNKYIKTIVFILVIMFMLSLVGCADNKKIEELQKSITGLQEQLADKEKKIAELQNSTTMMETTTTTLAMGLWDEDNPNKPNTNKKVVSTTTTTTKHVEERWLRIRRTDKIPQYQRIRPAAGKTPTAL